MKKFALLMVLVFLPVQTFAADPIPNTPTIAEKQPEFPKGPQYAAIAVSPKTLDYGVSQNMASQAEAEAAAKKQCADHSKTLDCQIAVHFYDACGALAVKPRNDSAVNMLAGESKRGGTYSADWGSSESSAERKAIDGCEDQAISGCRVAKSFCSK